MTTTISIIMVEIFFFCHNYKNDYGWDLKSAATKEGKYREDLCLAGTIRGFNNIYCLNEFVNKHFFMHKITTKI